MKLSFKTILPILLIFTLLILFAGCFITPSEEQPGYTPGTITGIIAAPCCTTSADPVLETCCVSPEYWCYYCQKTWKLQKEVKVILTYGEKEVATTTTNDKGEFTFTNVDPGKNYVVTAYCPDFADKRPLVKDVALQLIEGGSFDTNITDLVSTSLGLVVDFLVYYTDWGPEDISLDAVLADRPDFPNFPKFKKLVYEVRRVVENCEVNLLTDDAVQDATCRAAEEISKLTIGCGPGLTPPYTPPTPPGPCEGDVRPEIDKVDGVDQVLLNSSPVSSGSTLHLTVGKPIEFCVYATDPDNKLAQPLTYSISGSKDGNPFNLQMDTVNCVSGTPSAEEVGTYIVSVYVSDGCLTTPWGPITVIVDQLTVNASVSGGNGTALPLTQSVNYGASASIAFTPATGYHLASITDNGATIDITAMISPYVINPVIVNHTVVFAFSIDRLTVNASVSGGNGTALPLTQSVNYGASANIAFTPATDYHLASITDNGATIDITAMISPYVINPVIVNHTVVFAFDLDCKYLVSTSFQLTWYEVGTSNNSIVKYTSPKVPVLNSPTFNGTASVSSSNAGQVTVSVNLTDPYYIGSSTLIVTLEAYPDQVPKQGLFDVKVFLNGELFVTIPFDAQGTAGFFEIVFVPANTIMTNNCGESIVIDVTDVANGKVID